MGYRGLPRMSPPEAPKEGETRDNNEKTSIHGTRNHRRTNKTRTATEEPPVGKPLDGWVGGGV